MFCLKCGKPIKGDSQFCNYCGEKLPKIDKKQLEEIEADEKKKQLKTNENQTNDIQYAGFWLRVVAGTIDIIVILAIASMLGFVIGFVSRYFDIQLPDTDEFWNFIAGIIIWLYFALFESSRKQATIGHLALKLRVTDLYGERISFLRATGRHFAKFLSSICFGIGFFMIAFGKKKQGLHDIIAKCLVVKR